MADSSTQIKDGGGGGGGEVNSIPPPSTNEDALKKSGQDTPHQESSSHQKQNDNTASLDVSSCSTGNQEEAPKESNLANSDNTSNANPSEKTDTKESHLVNSDNTSNANPSEKIDTKESHLVNSDNTSNANASDKTDTLSRVQIPDPVDVEKNSSTSIESTDNSQKGPSLLSECSDNPRLPDSNCTVNTKGNTSETVSNSGGDTIGEAKLPDTNTQNIPEKQIPKAKLSDTNTQNIPEKQIPMEINEVPVTQSSSSTASSEMDCASSLVKQATPDTTKPSEPTSSSPAVTVPTPPEPSLSDSSNKNGEDCAVNSGNPSEIESIAAIASSSDKSEKLDCNTEDKSGNESVVEPITDAVSRSETQIASDKDRNTDCVMDTGTEKSESCTDTLNAAEAILEAPVAVPQVSDQETVPVDVSSVTLDTSTVASVDGVENVGDSALPAGSIDGVENVGDGTLPVGSIDGVENVDDSTLPVILEPAQTKTFTLHSEPLQPVTIGSDLQPLEQVQEAEMMEDPSFTSDLDLIENSVDEPGGVGGLVINSVIGAADGIVDFPPDEEMETDRELIDISSSTPLMLGDRGDASGEPSAKRMRYENGVHDSGDKSQCGKKVIIKVSPVKNGHGVWYSQKLHDVLLAKGTITLRIHASKDTMDSYDAEKTEIEVDFTAIMVEAKDEEGEQILGLANTDTDPDAYDPLGLASTQPEHGSSPDYSHHHPLSRGCSTALQPAMPRPGYRQLQSPTHQYMKHEIMGIPPLEFEDPQMGGPDWTGPGPSSVHPGQADSPPSSPTSSTGSVGRSPSPSSPRPPPPSPPPPSTVTYVDNKVKEESSEGVEVCHICGKVFQEAVLLVLHLRRHARESDKSEYTCGVCDVDLCDIESLKRHVGEHFGVQGIFVNDDLLLRCNAGNIMPSSKLWQLFTDLPDHQGTHPSPALEQGVHGGKKRICDGKKNPDHKENPDRKENPGGKKRLRKKAPVKKHPCDECNSVFLTYRVLRNHKRSHEKKRRYQCGVCPISRKCVGRLRAHYKQSHSNMIMCVYRAHCTGLFANLQDLKKHFKTVHNVSDNLMCEFCPTVCRTTKTALLHIFHCKSCPPDRRHVFCCNKVYHSYHVFYKHSCESDVLSSTEFPPDSKANFSIAESKVTSAGSAEGLVSDMPQESQDNNEIKPDIIPIDDSSISYSSLPATSEMSARKSESLLHLALSLGRDTQGPRRRKYSGTSDSSGCSGVDDIIEGGIQNILFTSYEIYEGTSGDPCPVVCRDSKSLSSEGCHKEKMDRALFGTSTERQQSRGKLKNSEQSMLEQPVTVLDKMDSNSFGNNVLACVSKQRNMGRNVLPVNARNYSNIQDEEMDDRNDSNIEDVEMKEGSDSYMDDEKMDETNDEVKQEMKDPLLCTAEPITSGIGEGSSNFMCTLCPSVFQITDILQRHIFESHLRDIKRTIVSHSVCDICDFGCSSRLDLCDHLCLHYIDQKRWDLLLPENILDTVKSKRHCWICNTNIRVKFIADHIKPRDFWIDSALLQDRDSGPVTCTACGWHSSSRLDFWHHVKGHLSQLPDSNAPSDDPLETPIKGLYECGTCNSTFTSRAEAYQHASSHYIHCITENS